MDHSHKSVRLTPTPTALSFFFTHLYFLFIAAKPIRAGQGHVQGGIRGGGQANTVVAKPVLPKTFSPN